MIKGHVYPKCTSLRSPASKRKAFDQIFKRICRTDFDGETSVGLQGGFIHRPSRKVLREMAWAAARKQAKEERANAQPPAPKPEKSRILRPDKRIVLG